MHYICCSISIPRIEGCFHVLVCISPYHLSTWGSQNHPISLINTISIILFIQRYAAKYLVPSRVRTASGHSSRHWRIELNLIAYRSEPFIVRSRSKISISKINGQINRCQAPQFDNVSQSVTQKPPSKLLPNKLLSSSSFVPELFKISSKSAIKISVLRLPLRKQRNVKLVVLVTK